MSRPRKLALALAGGVLFWLTVVLVVAAFEAVSPAGPPS